MKRVAIVGCHRIQDQLCVACAKCLKALRERDGEFARYKDDEVELVALGDCGDCPGLIMPKVTLMNEINTLLDAKFDIVHLGTCVVKAKKTGECPLDFEKIGTLIRENFGAELVVGTHNY